MSSKQLISYDEAKNSAFDNVLHRKSKEAKGGMRAMMNKDSKANAAAVDEYFQFWDNKKAEDEVEAIRQERTDNYASLTRQ
jgi:sterol 24-C-methyltransferase